MSGRGRRRLDGPGAHNSPDPAAQTIVSFHAHPDDEALMTGGTLALLAAAGHRVVLVTATAGAAGLTVDGVSGDALAIRRLEELQCSAAALGVARVVQLGYADSGWTSATATEQRPFSDVPLGEAAAALAEILVDERADVLTVYDANGGYGHRDHVRVHDVGIAAAALACTPRVLEATIDRTRLRQAVRLLELLHVLPAGTPVQRVPEWYSGRAQITHRIDVRPFATAKRHALACHLSQRVGGTGPRTVAILLRLPGPLFRVVCGTEWFVETDAVVPSTPLPDLLTPAPAGVGVG